MFRSKALRPIAGVVLVAFTALTLQPLTAAAQLPSAPKRAQASPATGEERFSRTLNEIHEILKEVVPQAAMPHGAGKPGEKVLQAVGPKMRIETEQAKPLPGVDVAGKVKALRGKYKELKSLEAEVDKGFKATEKHIRDKNLPPEILARHEQAVAEYEKRKAEFGALMQTVEAAADGKGELQSALASLGDFMAKYPNEKTHTPTDPNNLPWGSPKPVTRAPYTTPAQFKTSRLFGETVKVAQAGSLSGIGLPSTVLPATPMPADTAATEDVQITQAIRDLATSLNNEPVKIYNWVRNNIQFIPSYGSIQGSDMTLQTKRGNSFDTASLLIALLRAANVPSRYVYGTIEVPADKAMNWVGGVTVPQAAMNLMGQGGIPNMGVGSAGQIRSIRLEHVWVEAFVDYVPSRGAVNRKPNTWVPLDASFKQFDVRITSKQRSSFIERIKVGSQSDSSQGWVTGQNLAELLDTLSPTEPFESAALGSPLSYSPTLPTNFSLDLNQIVQAAPPILLGTLPYKTVAVGARFTEIPSFLRHKFQINLYANDFERASDSSVMSFTRSLPEMAGKKILLSFVPATDTDLATLRSFFPQPHADGSPISPAELPTSLAGYLVRLKGELRIDGQIVATGGIFSMGSEVIENAGVYSPVGGWSYGADNRVISGSITAIGLDLQGISEQQRQQLSDRLDQTRSQVAAGNLSGLTGQEVFADLLHAAVLSYFSSIDSNASVAAAEAGVVDFRQPSFGNFSLNAAPQYFFGIPRNVQFKELEMDIDRVALTNAHIENNEAARVEFNKRIGAQFSALEHLVTEGIFNSPTQPASAVSAVKALLLAVQEGQRIYVVTALTVDAALPALAVDESIKTEVQNAIAAGKEVIVSQRPVSLSGIVAVGYIIYDPFTGAGAYKISGGANGAKLAGNIVLGILIVAGAAAILILVLIYVVPAIAASLSGLYVAAANFTATFLTRTIGLALVNHFYQLYQRADILATMRLVELLLRIPGGQRVLIFVNAYLGEIIANPNASASARIIAQGLRDWIGHF